uniref:Uncharacterized protein n=1 Tax=Magallana gigas TaxID=29159 RepID=K1QRV2_MAGGI
MTSGGALLSAIVVGYDHCKSGTPGKNKCKPGVSTNKMCLNRLHNEAYERGCVDGPTNQHQAACTGDFCNNRTQTELDLVNNILSTLTKTTSSSGSTTSTVPMATTPVRQLYTDSMTCEDIFRKDSPQHQCRSEGFCAVYHANTGACNKPIDGDSRDFFHSCALFCNRCQESPRNCHQCGDLASSSPCSTLQVYTAPSTPCPAGLDFCMTDIHHDTSGNDHIYKRCVNRQTCETDWLAQTSDQDHCTRFGQVLTSGEFSCHFCCRGDGCNTRLVPDHSTFYTKT